MTVPLERGTRVRLRGHPIGVILTSFNGTIDRPDDRYTGYWIVRLAAPAYQRPHDARHPAVVLDEVREMAENLDVLDELEVEPLPVVAPLSRWQRMRTYLRRRTR